MDDIFKMMAAVELAIETVVWVAHEPVDQDDEMRDEMMADTRIFHGMVGKYLFTVSSFNIEYKGFPPGSRGYDGAVRCGSNIVRLTHPQSKRACELAEIAGAKAAVGAVTGVC